MTILKDLQDALKDTKGMLKDIKMRRDDMQNRSLARKSSAATLQFPVIMSRSINLDTAQSVTKALERQYATFVQLVISLNPYLHLEKEKMEDYINRIHQNNPTMMDLIESCVNVYSDEAHELYLFMSLNEGCNGSVLTSNKEQSFCIEDHLNKNKLNDLYKPSQITMSVAESSLDYFCKKNNIVMENKTADVDKMVDEIEKADDQLALNKIKAKNELMIGQVRDIRKDEIERTTNAARFNADLAKAEAEYKSKVMVKLSDNDVKKANELVPTTLSVTMQELSKDTFGGNRTYVLGVKGLMHPVNSNDIVSNLIDGHKAGNKFFNFIRATSGEISFIKDFVLSIGEIKEDTIKKHSKDGSHWWSTLKRRRSMAKMKNRFGGGQLLPNASIVCSMEEIVEMKDVYGIDLMNPVHVKKIMDRYFLLGFAIVDEAQELCYFIFDGENEYQALSFKGLEKENNSRNDFKDIYKMINSGRL